MQSSVLLELQVPHALCCVSLVHHYCGTDSQQLCATIHNILWDYAAWKNEYIESMSYNTQHMLFTFVCPADIIVSMGFEKSRTSCCLFPILNGQFYWRTDTQCLTQGLLLAVRLQLSFCSSTGQAQRHACHPQSMLELWHFISIVGAKRFTA